MLYKYNNNNEIIAIIIGELIAISFKSLIYLLLQRYFFTIIKIINKTCIAKKAFLELHIIYANIDTTSKTVKLTSVIFFLNI